MPLERALRYASKFLESLGKMPVDATVDLETLRARLARPLAHKGVPADRVIDELVADCEGGIVGSAGGRFYAWVIGGALPSALAADWLTSAWDQNAGLYAAGPAASVAEDVAASWLKDLLRLPEAASFAMVTGCQMAHVTCLAAARHAVLLAHGWDVEENGLQRSPSIRVIATSERHGSVERALRLLGLGRSCVTDILGTAEALRDALAEHRGRPTILVLSAADLNQGAYDPFRELIPLAKDYGAWVHIDGAFGLWAAASPKFRHFLDGADAADSWTTDGHKWLNVPYDCGYAFIRDREAHRASMSHRASYMIHDAVARDQIDWNPEWSRRARGFSTYAALRELGREGVANLIERCCDYARQLVLGIGGLPGAAVIHEPQLNQGLVRFGDDDAYTDKVIQRAVESGDVFVGGVNWKGRRCMRISVCNWRTTEDDVVRAVDVFRRILTAESL